MANQINWKSPAALSVYDDELVNTGKLLNDYCFEDGDTSVLPNDAIEYNDEIIENSLKNNHNINEMAFFSLNADGGGVTIANNSVDKPHDVMDSYLTKILTDGSFFNIGKRSAPTGARLHFGIDQVETNVNNGQQIGLLKPITISSIDLKNSENFEMFDTHLSSSRMAQQHQQQSDVSIGVPNLNIASKYLYDPKASMKKLIFDSFIQQLLFQYVDEKVKIDFLPFRFYFILSIDSGLI
jgi:hypothetical protein